MMLKKLNNKKGMTLVTVVIVVTVLVILSAMLIEAVMQSLVLTKRHKNIDFAYYAGESAIEKWSSLIYDQINDPDIGSGYTALNISDPASRMIYANHIKGKIDYTSPSSSIKTQLINITNAASASSTNSATVELEDIEVVDAKWDPSMNYMMDIYLGIKAKSSFSTEGTNYNAGNKIVYAVKPFRVACPVKLELESAIYAVGDVFINGNGNDKISKVNGDVFSFGSFAKKTISPLQYLYGGIYAINRGKINIFGNAYSRSFIRTGPYGKPDTSSDFSEIFIYKDAIAQCIQSFGNSNKIVVLRNAYTFDDVEVNGSRSLIAINGSFFGLSRGGNFNSHDESSAVVNSAPIHRMMSPDSFKSRIVINGDVMLGGGTFKIQDDGKAIGQIEDASIAWNTEDTDTIAHYKTYDDWGIKPAEDYHVNLRSTYGSGSTSLNITAVLNQFQVWNIVDPKNYTQISNWLTDIDNERALGAPDYGKGVVPTYGEGIPDELRGYCFYEVAANNRLYSRPLSIAPYISDNDFSQNLYAATTTVLGKYRLDNIFDAGNKIKFGDTYWNDYTISTNVRDTLFGDIHVPGSIGKFQDIQTQLKNKVHKYAQREYPTSAAGADWDVTRSKEFDNLLDSLEGKADSSIGTDAEDYILHIIKGDSIGTGEHDIDDVYSGKKGINVYTESSNSRSTTSDEKYYLIANSDPEIDLKVNGTFNGIIVTAGKVILQDNADIRGSIIAAGGGSYDGDVFYPQYDTTSGKPMNAIEESQVADLDTGKYAAVIFDTGADTKAASVDFFLGIVVDAADPAELEKVVDKARSTTHGAFMIPSSITTVDRDVKMLYLNKSARINLLEKFLNHELNLYDIF